MSRWLCRVAACGCVVAIALSTNASAQTPVIAPVESLNFDRPEAWALKYFTSPTLLTGLETPETMRPGSVTIGLELGWIPALSPSQERVGFNGTKQEDLNKTPIFLRPRLKVGLPWRLSLIVAVNPPIKTFGIEPRLLATGLEHAIVEEDDWTLKWRVYGQIGTATGAFTCPSRVLVFPPGSANNSYGCRALSSDVATLRYAGGELAGARRIARMGGLTPFLAVAINYMNSVFKVYAQTFDYIDHTRLEAHGMTFSASGGAAYPLTNRITVAAEAFYSPLTVRRTLGASSSIDGLFNVRGLVTYRVR